MKAGNTETYNRKISTKEISEQLFIAIRTTETHRKALMTKLEVNNVAGLVRIAVQEGLLD
ncbi:MAG: LuxR C-terminal-related transcriptional regulator [Cyclobacteriaceae bacterium]